MVSRTIIETSYFRSWTYVSVSTCSQSGFGTRRVRTGVAENCCNCSFGILRNACMRRVKTCVAEDCCESSSVILRNLCWDLWKLCWCWYDRGIVNWCVIGCGLVTVISALWNWRKKLFVVSSGAHGCISEGTLAALGCIYRDTYWRIIVVISRRKLSLSRTVTSQRARTLGFCVFLYGI